MSSPHDVNHIQVIKSPSRKLYTHWSTTALQPVYNSAMTMADPVIQLRLDEIRKERGWTLKELGRALGGMTESHVWQYETGHVGFTRKTLQQFAEQLGVNGYELIKHPCNNLSADTRVIAESVQSLTEDEQAYTKELVGVVATLDETARDLVIELARSLRAKGMVRG